MIVKNVAPGIPITAAWANSLVNAVNQSEQLVIPKNSVEFTKGKTNIFFENNSAWQISLTPERKVFLNAGQIYVNGLLVKAGGESSYNQFCSCTNYEKNCLKELDENGKFPVWEIEMEIPNVLTAENIDQVKAELKIKSSTNAETGTDSGTGNDNTENDDTSTEDEEKKETTKLTIAINDTDGKQLVSGSIYITLGTGNVSHVGDDGILIEDLIDEKTKQPVCKIALDVSVIGEDGVTVIDSKYSGFDKTTDDLDNPVYDENAGKDPRYRLFTIRGEGLSFVTGDGLKVIEENIAILEENGMTLAVPKNHREIKLEPMLSIIGGDGIEVVDLTHDEEENGTSGIENTETTLQEPKPLKFRIDNLISFVNGDGIEVIEKEEEITDPKDKTKKKKVHSVEINNNISFIAGDGIKIEETEEEVMSKWDSSKTEKIPVVKIHATKYSFIGKDGIEILEEEEEIYNDEKSAYEKTTVVTLQGATTYSFIAENGIRIYEDKETEKKNGEEIVKMPIKITIVDKSISIICQDPLRLKATVQEEEGEKEFQGEQRKYVNEVWDLEPRKYSLIAGDGVEIEVEEDEQSFTTFYTIKSNGMSEIEFDELYFTIESGEDGKMKVTLNEETLEQVANEAAAEIGVTLTATGLLESTTSYEIKPSTTTQEPLPIVTVMNTEIK